VGIRTRLADEVIEMRRRDFVIFIGGAMTWMSVVRAQESRPAIGVLSSAYRNAYPGGETAFLQGLKDAGFIERGNIIIEWRWADNHYDRLPSLAAELLGHDVRLLACLDAPSAAAAKAATKNHPDCLRDRC
jgi:putative ABC transport system substrate-binding protein